MPTAKRDESLAVLPMRPPFAGDGSSLARSGEIALFDKDGKPLPGERSVEVVLYDAGTEVNQAPGVGPDQGPRQDPSSWRQGELEHATVQAVRDTFAYPPVGEVIRVTVSTGKSA
jgi:hypothetical protein